MCPPYHEDFLPAPTHRPVVREKRYINRAVKGQGLSMNHAMFLPSTLDMVRSIVHAPEQRQYLETDLRLLTGEADVNVPWYVNQLVDLYRQMPFSMVDQINEGELHRILDAMNCGFSPAAASVALWGMDVQLSDHYLPFDQLSWGLHYLQSHSYLPDVDPTTILTSENGAHTLVIQLIIGLADKLLITQSGTMHTAWIKRIENWPGVSHTILEEDTFGPLRCGLITTKGTICYG